MINGPVKNNVNQTFLQTPPDASAQDVKRGNPPGKRGCLVTLSYVN